MHLRPTSERKPTIDVPVSMKVIFLDIDGVLNSDSTPNPRTFPYIIDDQLLARFKELVRRTGAKVVLSSTWRVDPIGILAAKYYEVPFDDRPGAPRCEEIQAWLRQHQEVTRYVALDDDDDCLDELPLFQPSSKTGLTQEIAYGIEEFLAGRSDKDMSASAMPGWDRTFMPCSDARKADGLASVRSAMLQIVSTPSENVSFGCVSARGLDDDRQGVPSFQLKGINGLKGSP
jgi:hypothetical protein